MAGASAAIGRASERIRRRRGAQKQGGFSFPPRRFLPGGVPVQHLPFLNWTALMRHMKCFAIARERPSRCRSAN